MIMQERVQENPKISIRTPWIPEEFLAGEDGALEAVRLRRADNGVVEDVPVAGAFVAIGHIPRSELVSDQIATDDEGYVKTDPGSTRTDLAGVFAIGDLVDHTYRQAITAAGSGCQGALDAEWYLRDHSFE
jgi:thioredoxin reductase (NADPH)